MHSDGMAGNGPDSAPGTMIADRYRLEKALGRGGMGVVWEALDTSLNRKVAVKGMLYPGAAPHTRARWVDRARREAQAIARIEHQNVVAVHDVVEDGEQVWIVMELLNSRSLADLLAEQQQLAVPHTARIGLQVLRGLTAVHAAGVVHRDVKPHNILFRPDGRALLMDFGIATFEGAVQVTRTHEIIGTAQYLAPELFSHTADKPRAAIPASDLWALGITLYEMVEGRRPFDGPTDLEVLVAVRESPVPPMKYAGPLSTLIEALLRKNPAERPDAAEAEQMLQATTLDSFTLDTPPSPKPTAAAAAAPPDPGPGRVRGTSRPGAGARTFLDRWKVPVAVLCTAVLAGGAWFAWGQPDGSGNDHNSASDKPGNEKPYKYEYKKNNDVLKFGVKDDQTRMSQEAGDGNYEGFEPDLARVIGDLMGYDEENVEFEEVTTSNRHGFLKTDGVDMVIATYSIDDKRSKDENVDFLGPYYKPLQALLVKNKKYKNLLALQESDTSRVCTTTESIYDKKWIEEQKLTPMEKLPDKFIQCVERLRDEDSNVDAVATEDVVADGYVEENPDWRTIRRAPDPKGYGVAVKRSKRENTQILKKDVCHALEQIMKPGSGKGKNSMYEDLYDKHLREIRGNKSAPREPRLDMCEDHL